MTRHHRLDSKDPREYNDVTTGESGFIHDPKRSRTDQPESPYPKLPETNYAHDEGTSTLTHSPGPFHGDDLVSHGVTAPDVKHGGTVPASYVYDNEINQEDTERTEHEFHDFKPVDVRVVDALVKPTRIIHQIITPILIAPGTTQRILGKDPTRRRLYLTASTTGVILVQPNFEITGIAAASVAQFGFPLPAAALRFDSEEEFWGYCASDATGPGIYVTGYAEYLRSPDTLEEYYDGTPVRATHGR